MSDSTIPTFPEILTSLGSEERDAPAFELPGHPDVRYRACGLRRAGGATEVDVLFGATGGTVEVLGETFDGRLIDSPDRVAVRMDFASGQGTVIDAAGFFPAWSEVEGMRWRHTHRHDQDFDRLKIVAAMLTPEVKFVRLHEEEPDSPFVSPTDPSLVSVSLESVAFSMRPSEDEMRAWIHGEATYRDVRESVELHWSLAHHSRVHIISFIPDAKAESVAA